MREIFRTPVPLYATVLALCAVIGIDLLFILKYRETIYKYELLIPQADQNIPLQFGSWPALSQPDFFYKVHERFINEKVNFVEADLSSMRLTVYEGGIAIKDFPILTKGKEGSWWETPAGLYKIQDRLENHFSGFAGVFLPWSMPFQGNFFIHGWPYYAGGDPVASTYSGGCIRLSTEDAKMLYEMVKVGTPVLVFEKDFAVDSFNYTLKGPDLTAKNYISADLKNHFVFFEQGAEEKVPIASLTKLMTALTAVEYVDIEKRITITEEMLVPTSLPRLKAGEKMSLLGLLYPLLMESSNEAAEAIMGFVEPGRFVALMNEKARSIGMTQTHFEDASGSGAGNVSTPNDLFLLAKYLYNNRSFILHLTAGDADNAAYEPPPFSDLKNYNVFVGEDGFIGGKVGMTSAAQETIFSIFEVEIGGEKRPLAIIVLGSPDRELEARRLLMWTKANY